MIRAAVLLSVFSIAAAGWAADGKTRAAAAARARELAAAGRPGEAAQAWEQALSDGASARELDGGLTALGRCYEAAGNYQKAIASYQRALRLKPKDADRLLDLARVYALVDLNDEAVALYRRALERGRDRKDAVLALASVCFKAGRLEEAHAQAELYARWEPRDLAAQRLLARIEENMGELDPAARRWEAILARDPSPQGYHDVGRLWARQGQYDLADAALRRAGDLGLRDPDVLLLRGAVSWLKEDDSSAAAHWTKALEKDPGLAAAQFFLALLDRTAGRAPAARDRMKKAEAAASSDYVRGLARAFLAAPAPARGTP